MVTIVITYTDESDFLQEALRSALAQTVSDYNILVVCNDDIPPANEDSEFAGHPAIQWLHEPVRGSAHARNAGLKYSTGDWIQYLDVDDILLPDKIKNQLVHPDAGAIVSPHIYRHLSGRTEFSRWQPDDIWAGMIGGKLGSTSSMLWNRKALIAVKGWNTDYQSNQEYELLFRLAKNNYPIIPVGHHETIVRDRLQGSITKMTRSSRAEQGIILRESIWEYLVANQMDTTERLTALRQYIFRQLRATYRRNTSETLAIFKRYFENASFSPEGIGIPLYPLMYRTFGFSRTEYLFNFYSTIRDRFLPFLPTNK